MNVSRLVALLAAAALAGCGEPPSSTDGGNDGGLPDAGHPLDAGDGGPGADDSGARDGGDAGQGPDAGDSGQAIDGGDAGGNSDAGDSGSFDAGPPMRFIVVARDGGGFVDEAGAKFVPYGFNYDHDEGGRFIEEYWVTEWNTVVEDFTEMKALGANTVRLHLDLGSYMTNATTLNTVALDQFSQLLVLAESLGLRLDLTGLANYRSTDVLPWYDNVTETGRWAIQTTFWQAIATRAKDSPAVFAYDLMNEPAVPAGVVTEWRLGALGTSLFSQYLTRDPAGRTAQTIAKAWIATLTSAIRAIDTRHPITVGLIPFTGGPFAPSAIASDIDYFSIHMYPKHGAVPAAVSTVRTFAAQGKPVVIEETFPLSSGSPEHEMFLRDAMPWTDGVIGFYWGVTLEQITPPATIVQAIVAGWLNTFIRLRSIALNGTPLTAGLTGFWSPSRQDRIFTSAPNDAGLADGGFISSGHAATLLNFNTGNAVPLCGFNSTAKTDHIYDITCDVLAMEDAGYAFTGAEGWVWKDAGTGRQPLFRYASDAGTQHFYTLTRDDLTLGDAGFVFERIEGYALP